MTVFKWPVKCCQKKRFRLLRHQSRHQYIFMNLEVQVHTSIKKTNKMKDLRQILMYFSFVALIIPLFLLNKIFSSHTFESSGIFILFFYCL